MEEHNCKAPDNMKCGHYGAAIDDCWEEDGMLWVGNSEYASTVKYCPFCGYTIK